MISALDPSRPLVWLLVLLAVAVVLFVRELRAERHDVDPPAPLDELSARRALRPRGNVDNVVPLRPRDAGNMLTSDGLGDAS